MRITNSMMSNRILMNINRNASTVGRYYQQMSSTKLFQFPSESPIAASRVLKYRTTLAENAQYQRNAAQGLSWMDITEKAFNDCVDIFKNIKERVVHGDGVETFEDKQKIVTEIKSYVDQLGIVMNTNYTGRYIFSGYRTDEPGTFLKDESDISYTDITQIFERKDMEKTMALETDDINSTIVAKDVNIYKIAYKNADNIKLYIPSDGSTPLSPRIMNSKDSGAYSPGDDEIIYIEDTGELVFGKNAAQNTDSLKVVYDKNGFEKGELNPKAYFKCTDINGDTYTMEDQDIEYEFGEGSRFSINSLAKDVFTDKMYGDLINFCDTVLNIEISNLDDVVARLREEDPNLTEDEAIKKANEFIDEEKLQIDKMLQSRFSNMITTVEKHASSISKAHTDLGARASRVEMIRNRLETDEESYTKLLSENQDTDLVETAMLLSNAEAAYMASMQVGMSIIQTSLVNFL